MNGVEIPFAMKFQVSTEFFATFLTRDGRRSVKVMEIQSKGGVGEY